MKFIDRFSFLTSTENWECYDKQDGKVTIMYKYKNPSLSEEVRLLVWVPKKNKDRGLFQFNYFIKGQKDTFHRPTHLEDLPEELRQLAVKCLRVIEEQNYLKDLL